MMCSGAAVITPANAATATTIAKHDTAVNVTTPQPDKRIANTDVTAAAIAASSTLGVTRSARDRQKAGNRCEFGGDHAEREPGDRVPICPVRNRREQQSKEAGQSPQRPRWRRTRG